MTLFGATPFLETMSTSIHTMRQMEVFVKMKRARSGHQVSKQARCDGLRLLEDVAILKQERRRRLKLSLLIFFFGFIIFFIVFVKPLI